MNPLTTAERDAPNKQIGPVVSHSFNPDAESWREEALCGDMGTSSFFAPSLASSDDINVRGLETRLTKALCWGCPVRQYCLGYALAMDEEYGLWGGLTSTERRDYVAEGRTDLHAASTAY